jgi:hypothetical protein
MTYETIICARRARGVASVTLNRPERGNAMNPALIDELGGCMQELGADEAVRVIVLRGAGKHFCAGADVGGRGEGEPKFTLATMLETIERTPKPTIAVVQGAAAGGGMALAACFDEPGALALLPAISEITITHGSGHALAARMLAAWIAEKAGWSVTGGSSTSSFTLSNHGRAWNQTKQFWPDMVGFKYKMSNIQAAIGCGQMERIEQLTERKREIFAIYRDSFQKIHGIKSYERLSVFF